LVLLVFLVLSV